MKQYPRDKTHQQREKGGEAGNTGTKDKGRRRER
jgi:hypothetical protein